MEILLGIICLILFVLLLKVFTLGGGNQSAQLLDLKNEINELKNKQLESQNQSLAEQHKLFQSSHKLMSDQLTSLFRLVNDGLNKSQSNIQNQLNNNSSIIGELRQKLGNLEQATIQIQDIGKDISSLQDILSAPKLRGNLGEYLLEELLKQIFPQNNYEVQYSFKNGTQVDAIIKLGEGIVPIDSKFPLESFQRFIASENDSDKKRFKKEFITSVKTRIDEIANKYINPDENTFDFALMYIPAENVFYETIVNDSLTQKEYEIFNYSIKKHVIPVSPNSFYAYLMAIVYGLKGFQIEKQAKRMIGELTSVQNSFANFYKDFTLIGKHLDNASNKYRESQKKAEKLNDKIQHVTGIDSPLLEDKSEIFTNEK